MRRLLLAMAAAIGAAFPSGAAPARIIDTHIHIWTLPRADGGAFPGVCCADTHLGRDFTMDDYRATEGGKRIDGVILVESSGGSPDLLNSNRLMLESVEGDDLLLSLVGRLDIKSPDFPEQLAVLRANPRFVGIRAHNDFYDPSGAALHPVAKANLEELARHGLALDILGGSMLKLAAVAPELPANLVVVLDHLAEKKRDFAIEPEWEAGVRAISPYPNIHVKFSWSTLVSQAEAGASGFAVFEPNADPERYRPLFDVLFDALGPERLVFGSNWPVSDRSGSFHHQIDILEALLDGKGQRAMDLVFAENALRIYGPRRASSR